jgi:signal transduction histidine kinase
MSHELRTPLNSMLGYAQILRNDPSMPGHRIDAIDTIRQGGEHLIALIDDILDIARIEAGRFRLRSADTDFADFLAQIVRMFQVAAGRKGIGFRVQLRDRIPRIVRMDQRRVRQLLLNLIGNAVKFTSRGEVVVSIGYSGEIARIRVRDTGPGIPREDIERIFQPFQRARNTPHTDDSTGLGLTVSRMITEQMGGELAVEVTAQVPARMARGENQSLTITPEAWDAMPSSSRRRRTGTRRCRRTRWTPAATCTARRPFR